MHEMALAESVVQLIQQTAGRESFQRVVGIELEIGQLSAVEVGAMRFALQAATRHTLAETAEVTIVEIAGRARCQHCQHEFPVQDRLTLCPHCASPHLGILAGEQMRLKNLVVQ